ncbi:SDR family NAD(P)-dependent oxidoreductase [Lichenihabitans sp. Uapishka_5]|uniref:SDR family NAD(P)-dependent oxidoreductase n=1 Tax=Lichenihabitans sp. Uapishka_5 TaxID=3037302 RepID=UPI0029E805CB|nr:SDR family oxidoreductase [Lichenihabitans sp. Uapishka_5]MDX7951159.1 SDR family NAD(P)-dependent oxidoreductase [Lichenihabitans sp. Uapishka_5]
MTEIATYPSLRDAAVLITGGGSGIGAALTRRFAQQGARVGFLDIADAPSQALVAELTEAGHKVAFAHADLRRIDELKAGIAALREQVGPFGVLLNNAAHDERHAFADITPDYFDERIAVNLKHQFFAAQAVLPDMQAAQKGCIINFGSVSWMLGQGNMAIYTAAKSAILGFTRSLARDYGKDNIRVLSIAPGWIMTERQRDLWLTPEADRDRLERQCLKRALVPDDVARTALFFASDEAGAMTNQSYLVDGGWV